MNAFDFDGDGDFDAFDQMIEYSIVFDEGEPAECPSCYGVITPKEPGTLTCPHCEVQIRVD